MRILVRSLIFLIVAQIPSQFAFASYSVPQVVEVPVERLVKNLQTQIVNFDKDPEDHKFQWKKWDLIANLARLHAMSYALKIEKIKANKDEIHSDRLTPDFGFVPVSDAGREFPDIVAATNAKNKKDANSHLQEAIRLYRLALTNDRTLWTAEMGLGWVLQQDGKIEEAKAHYRKVVAATQNDANDNIGDELSYVVKFPLADGARRIIVNVNGVTAMNKDIWALTFEHIIRPDPKIMIAYNNMPYSSEEKIQIDNCLSAIEKSFDHGSLKEQKKSVEDLKTAISSAEQRMHANPKAEIAMPLGEMNKDIDKTWAVYTRGIEVGNVKQFILSANIENDGKLLIRTGSGHVLAYKSEHPEPKAAIPLSMGARSGPSVKYEFKLATANGSTKDSMTADVATKRDFRDYETPPADFTVKSQLGKLGLAETAMYLTQLLDPKKRFG